MIFSRSTLIVGFAIPEIAIVVPQQMGIFNMTMLESCASSFIVGAVGMAGKIIIETFITYFRTKLKGKINAGKNRK